MCGRYAQSRSSRAIADDLAVQQVLLEARPSWNVAPRQDVPVVLERVEEDTPIRQLRALRWGLVPPWAKDATVGDKIINARVETIFEKNSFRSAVLRKRAVVPMDGYFEWQAPPAGHGPKTPYFLHAPDGRPLRAAGLYELWRDRSRADDDPDRWLWTVVVITRQAVDTLGHIHDRCPVLLPQEWTDTWLDPGITDKATVRDLLAALPDPQLEPRQVGRAVGNVRNDGPQLVEPAGAGGEGHTS